MLGLGTAAPAHEAFRIVGTVATLKPTQIGVKTKQGRTVYIELTKKTMVLRDKTKVPATELKTGLSVVVDARGDDDSDLTAKQMRIAPAIAPPRAATGPQARATPAGRRSRPRGRTLRGR